MSVVGRKLLQAVTEKQYFLICLQVYIAEMASPDLRGLLGSSFQLVVTIGVLSAYALGKLPV